MTWKAKLHETQNDMKRKMTWKAKLHEKENYMKSKITWNTKWHETPKNADADADADARFMTPSRNTRSYTLRSVPLSPGRSFFQLSTLSLNEISAAHNYVSSDEAILRTHLITHRGESEINAISVVLPFGIQPVWGHTFKNIRGRKAKEILTTNWYDYASSRAFENT